MWVGTFHGLCNRMLRIHHREAKLPETFQILDSSDQLSAIKRLMKAMNVDKKLFLQRKFNILLMDKKMRESDLLMSNHMIHTQKELMKFMVSMKSNAKEKGLLTLLNYF